MAITRDFPQDDPSWLTLTMQALGYKGNLNGVCYAASHLAIQADFTDEADIYLNRFGRILDLYLKSKDEYEKDLTKEDGRLQAEIEETLDAAAIKYQDEAELQEDGEKAFPADGKFAQEQMKLMQEVLERYFRKNFNVFSKSDQADILALFDAAEVEYHHADKDFELWSRTDEEKVSPSSERILAGHPLDANLASQLTDSVKMEKLGGLTRIVEMEIEQSNDKFALFFFEETKKLMEEAKESLGIIISSSRSLHSVELFYNVVKKSWKLFDIDHLPPREFKEEKELTSHLLQLLSPQSLELDELTKAIQGDRVLLLYDLYAPGSKKGLLSSFIKRLEEGIKLYKASHVSKETGTVKHPITNCPSSLYSQQKAIDDWEYKPTSKRDNNTRNKRRNSI